MVVTRRSNAEAVVVIVSTARLAKNDIRFCNLCLPRLRRNRHPLRKYILMLDAGICREFRMPLN
jgi:hypothetical protein